MSNERKRIVVSDIISDLENGLQRKEIKTKYGLTGKQMVVLFNHPSLKGRKAKKQVQDTLEIIDDLTTVQDENGFDIINDEIEEVTSEETIITEEVIEEELPTTPSNPFADL